MEVDWDEIRRGFWAMVGMASVSVHGSTDLSSVVENIDKILKEKVKEQWKK